MEEGEERRKEGRKEGRKGEYYGIARSHRGIIGEFRRGGDEDEEDEEDRASRVEKSPSKVRKGKTTRRHSNGPILPELWTMREISLPTAALPKSSDEATGLLLRPTPHCTATPQPPSLIVNGEYNRPSASERVSESAGFSFRPGRSVSSSHFPPSLRLESAWVRDRRRRIGDKGSQSVFGAPIHSIRLLNSNRFSTQTERRGLQKTRLFPFAISPSKRLHGRFSQTAMQAFYAIGARERRSDTVRSILVRFVHGCLLTNVQ